MSIFTEVHEDVIQAHIPVIVYIIILMTVGLLGNPIIIFFYGFKVKATPSHVFIVSLAVFDLVTCSVSMPLELADILRFYTFKNGAVCSAVRFISYFACISSGLTLLAIASFRFRKICQPFKKQINLRITKIIIISVILTSLTISWPVVLLYHLTAINITDSHHPLTMYDCTTRRDEDYEIYVTAYNIFCFLTFGIAFAILITIYSLIGKKLREVRKCQASRSPKSEMQTPRRRETTSADNGREHTENNIDTDQIRNDNDAQNTIQQAQNVQESNSSTKFSTSQGTNSSETPSQHNGRWRRKAMRGEQRTKSPGQRLRTGKYTAVMFFITVAFVLTFVPFLCLTTWRSLSHELEQNMSKSELVIYQIAIRSFLLSSACNPIIYGFLSTEFKQYIVYASQICFKRIRNMASTDGRGIASSS